MSGYVMVNLVVNVMVNKHYMLVINYKARISTVIISIYYYIGNSN